MIDHWKFFSRWCASCTVLPGLIVLAACKASLEPDFPDVSTSTAPAPAAGAAGAADATPNTTIDNDRPELIHVGDSLTVNFSGLPTVQPQLQVQVDENGKITLIENETFSAAGKTRAQLEKEVRDRYVPDKFKK